MMSKPLPPRECPFCHKMFVPKTARQLVCNDDHYAPCPDCGKPVKIVDRSYAVFLKDGPKRCKECARKAARARQLSKSPEEKQAILEKRKETNKKKFGSEFAIQNEEIRQKQKQAFLDRYGTEHPIQNEAVKEKRRQSNLEKYGVKNVLQLPEVKQKVVATLIERYGVDHSSRCPEIVEKRKETLMDHYGVDNPMKSEELKERYQASAQNKLGVSWPTMSETVKETRRRNNQEKYGVDAVSQLPKIKEKVKETNLERYGVEYYAQTNEYKEKYKETSLKRYGTLHPMQSKEVQDKAIKTKQAKYGVSFSRQTFNSIRSQITDASKAASYYAFRNDPVVYIKTHYNNKPTVYQLSKDLGCTDTPIYEYLARYHAQDLVQYKRSTMEQEMLEFLKQIDPSVVVIHNDRKIIAPKEIDLYLPDYKIGIECNPTITHNSSILDPWGNLTDYKYHQRKTDDAEKAGVQLFHIFGYEWTNKREILESMIRNLMGKNADTIYARNLDIRHVPMNEAKEFLNKNHRQGFARSFTQLGLYTKTNELVSLMTFSPVRHTLGKSNSFNGWELVRFCSKLNTNVIGGASKLFKHFLSDNPDIKNIVSFSDRSHTKGNLYETLGFTEARKSDPSYVWVRLADDAYFSRVACQKRYLPKLLNDSDLDLSRTEREIMISHGYVQVFDSGVIRWEYRR